MHADIEAILAEAGGIRMADHPRLKSALRRGRLDGTLISPLPGVFVAGGTLSTERWLGAVAVWSAPEGVIHHRSAASLWLPMEKSRLTWLSHPTLRSRGDVVVSRRRIPPEFVVEHKGIRAACAAYAAVELATTDEGRAICDALRLRLADEAGLSAAVDALSRTAGHAERRRVAAAAATNPWSYAELRLHHILRAARIDGWVANRPIEVRGRRYWPDVRFKRRKLVLEFDGREFHDTSSAFISDRERLNEFAAGGFTVLRFGWEHLDCPDYVACLVTDALRRASPYE